MRSETSPASALPTTLITGAAGFAGSHLLELLAPEDGRLIAWRRPLAALGAGTPRAKAAPGTPAAPWIEALGIQYFLRTDGRPFQIEQSKVEMVVRTAARSRPAHMPRPPLYAVDHARKEIRRELIRRVVEEMLQAGL